MRTGSGVRRLALRAVAGAAAVFLTIGLLFRSPGSFGSLADVLLTSLAVGLAWLGVAGVVRERPLLAELAALGLALLGLWQGVARVYALPAGVVMAVAAALVARAGRAREPAHDGAEEPAEVEAEEPAEVEAEVREYGGAAGGGPTGDRSGNDGGPERGPGDDG